MKEFPIPLMNFIEAIFLVWIHMEPNIISKYLWALGDNLLPATIVKYGKLQGFQNVIICSREAVNVLQRTKTPVPSPGITSELGHFQVQML